MASGIINLGQRTRALGSFYGSIPCRYNPRNF